MTEKRFQYIRGVCKHGIHDVQKDGKYRKGYRTTYDDFDLDKITDELNIREDKIKRLEKENEQLKKEKESWKSIACDNSSFNSILLHELDIAKEQGYTVSDPFKKLMGKCE